MNYSKVTSQTNSISDNASQLSSLIKLLEQMEQDYRAVWKDQAADTFISELSALRSEMNRIRSQMSNLASTTKCCADRVQREDREVKERATTLRLGH